MDQSLYNRRICFFGAGSMAEAIARGLIEQKIAAPERISMLNRQNEQRLKQLTELYGVVTTGDPAEKERLLAAADIVVLAMKPKDARSALDAVKNLFRPDQLLISVIAGLSIETIENIIGVRPAIVRTMPNTSSTIGLGATGVSFNTAASPTHRDMTLQMFSAVGEVSVVDEQLLDIVTGVSGSGPAYVYYLMEAMIEAGVEGGLSPAAAKELTVQTVLGAAQMVKLTGEDPAVLRRKVTSPNGTTQAALETLDRFQFSAAVSKAVLRAAERAKEIGETLKSEA